MSTRERRMKATEVLQESTSLFGEKVPFERAFPMISDLEVRVVEHGRWRYSREPKQQLLRAPLGEYIDCSHELCFNGGFSIGEILRAMTKAQETEWQGTKYCRGYWGSPKGHRKYRDCPHRFDIKVKVSYKGKSR